MLTKEFKVTENQMGTATLMPTDGSNSAIILSMDIKEAQRFPINALFKVDFSVIDESLKDSHPAPQDFEYQISDLHFDLFVENDIIELANQEAVPAEEIPERKGYYFNGTKLGITKPEAMDFLRGSKELREKLIEAAATIKA